MLGRLSAYSGASAAEYATVISATPVTGSVTTPRQDCANGEQVVQPQPSGAGAAIGAIAGGVIGNQFGHGFGRAAATGAGVVAGAAVGNNVEASATPPVAVPVRNCRTVNAVENRVVGYDVVYEYNGQRYRRDCPRIRARASRSTFGLGGNAPLDRVGPRRLGAVPPAYAQAAPSYSEVPPAHDDAEPAYYGPGYAPAPVYYSAPELLVLHRARGDRPGHRLLDRQHLAPRLSRRLAWPSRLALSGQSRIEKGPAGPLFLFDAREASRQPAALATTRTISRHLFE